MGGHGPSSVGKVVDKFERGLSEEVDEPNPKRQKLDSERSPNVSSVPESAKAKPIGGLEVLDAQKPETKWGFQKSGSEDEVVPVGSVLSDNLNSSVLDQFPESSP